MQYHIKEQEWEQIYCSLKSIRAIHIYNEHKLRLFVEAIYYMVRSGCQWRLLPKFYGNWRAIHARFQAWSSRKIWDKVLQQNQNDPDMELVMIDSTIVRAHACAAGYGKNSQDQQALGRSKGGFSTKIHALVDALGNPLKFTLTSGQRHDIIKAPELTEKIINSTITADKGYDSRAFIETIILNNCKPIIPCKKNRLIQRDYDKHLYKERHLIECFFNKIKHFRRIFSRFDKIAAFYLSFLNFVATLIWLR